MIRSVCGAAGLTAMALAMGGCNVVLGLGDFEDAPGGGGASGTGGGATATTSTSSTGGGMGGTGGAGGAGEGGMPGQGGAGGFAPVCNGGEVVACDYSGDPTTENVGACKAGAKTCADDGSGFGECKGEVTPLDETCADPSDEDCDGHDCARWAHVYGDSSYQSSHAIASDSQGNIYVLGWFQGSLAFVPPGLSSAGASDVFLVKLDPKGNHLWSKQFGDATGQHASDIAIDASDNVIVVGGFEGIINFGGANLTSVGNEDIFVAKLSPAGDHVWSKRLGNSLNDSVAAVAVDQAGNVFLAGGFLGAIDFGTGTVTSAGARDIYVVKLGAANGVTSFTRTAGDSLGQDAVDIAVDSQGNVIVAGDFAGTVNFGAGNLVSDGVRNVFLARYDNAGSLSWAKTFAGPGEEYATSVVVDPSSNAVVLTGTFTSTILLGGATLATAGQSDIFLAKLTSGGNHVWSKGYGSTSGENGPRVAVGTAGQVVMSGRIYGSIDFGGGVLPENQSGAIYLAELTNAGDHVWSKRFNASVGVLDGAVAVDLDGNVLLECQPDGIVDLGTGPLATAGGYDVAIAKLAP